MPRPSNAPFDAALARLGKNVQMARKKAGFTQESFAEHLDLHPRTIQKIEQGEVNMPTTTLIRIRGALKCRWRDILPPDE